MKKFGTFPNPNMPLHADRHYDRFNRDRNLPLRATKRTLQSLLKLKLPEILATSAVVGLVFVVSKPAILGILAPITGCNIKGNISMNSREKIYHVPGQHYYEATKISPQYGERFFCSEAEARAAGWRKARS